MRTASYSELRRNLAALIDRVNGDHEPLLIIRDRGKPAAVLISLKDFASCEETHHLLKSPRNAERLLESIVELEQAPTLRSRGGRRRPSARRRRWTAPCSRL
ncbi:type II toxin-antitoxin system Phd/YefM family antitoxin [Labrys wisconsinensis]|uniref:type II toxin-antitoxin system Phd/YefM family antitoxin n=1 Tax=Labrys wisconsinensis TaxID=425677 RepID=UPI0027D79372|nr:type II toxin-antitoxin system prevent-host-death family antitoxin [Labrys wisconsinensis]